MTSLDIGEILDKRKPTERSVVITLDGTVDDQIKAKRREIAAASLTDFGTLASPRGKLENELEDLLIRREAHQEVMTFRAIPRPDFDVLKTAAPPTAEQEAEGYTFDPDVFGPLIIAASSWSPQIDEDAAQRIWDEWSDGDVNAIFNAAYGVNVEARVRPFVEGSAPTPDSGQSSDTASRSASLIPSS